VEFKGSHAVKATSGHLRYHLRPFRHLFRWSARLVNGGMAKPCCALRYNQPLGGVAKYFANPPNHFACGKHGRLRRVLSLAIARFNAKWPHGPATFTLFPPSLTKRLFKTLSFATAPFILLKNYGLWV
jgi:hypothetical protein